MVRCAPVLCTTATATANEIEEVKDMMGFRDINTVVLKSDPVQSQFKFVRVERPSNLVPVSGVEEVDGTVKPGLLHRLESLYLKTYVSNIKLGLPVKKALFLCRNTNDVVDLYDEICEKLPDQAADPFTCPFVMNHSSIGPITAEHIRNRRSDISLYLATSVMLLGLDLDDIDIVVMIRPFNHCHDILQAAGRGGRKLENAGKRRRVVFYLLYNKSDISTNVPGLTDEVREFCVTQRCLKAFLRNIFGYVDSDPNCADGWCCSNCD